MAADWIMMRVDLAEDPAVILIAERLGLDVDAVLGKLFRLWKWANTHTKTGHVAGVTLKWVDAHLRADSISKVLVESGWLRESDGGIVFPNFKRWNSKSAKKRGLATLRQRRHRALRGALQERDTPVTREEKSRGEEHIPTDHQDPSSPSEARRPKSSRARSSSTKFVVPTVEEVAAYCRERGNGVDATKFVNFYGSKGWKVGKSPMVDWRKSVITWERDERQEAGTHSGVREWIEESHADGTLYEGGQ